LRVARLKAKFAENEDEIENRFQLSAKTNEKVHFCQALVFYDARGRRGLKWA
jgi:hypothetical protein